MGTLVAHELARSFPHEIQPTLLLRNKSRLDDFLSNNSHITVVKSRNGDISTTRSQILADNRPPMTSDQKPSIISNMILSTKTYQTEAALEPYVSHLTPESNIIILQNGMGMARHLCETFWPNSFNRPNIYQAISTHGAYKTAPNVVHHASDGSLKISSLKEEINPNRNNSNLEEPKLINSILNTMTLNASYVPYNTFTLLQMEKLIINACINPLTAILDCLNGDLLYGERIANLMKRVISEAVSVLKAEYEVLKTIPEAEAFLNESRLLNSVIEICKSTSENSSSMREDLKHLNHTEISWINGFIVRLGREHHIHTPTNNTLISLVENKLSIDKAIEERASQVVL